MRTTRHPEPLKALTGKATLGLPTFALFAVAFFVIIDQSFGPATLRAAMTLCHLLRFDKL